VVGKKTRTGLPFTTKDRKVPLELSSTTVGDQEDDNDFVLIRKGITGGTDAEVCVGGTGGWPTAQNRGGQGVEVGVLGRGGGELILTPLLVARATCRRKGVGTSLSEGEMWKR